MSSAITPIGVALLSVLLMGYFGQMYLPPPKPTFIGLDLGTTYSCVGVYMPGTGNVTVFITDQGSHCIPSVVTIHPNGSTLIGHLALPETYPKNTIYDAKRFIGKRFGREAFEEMQKRYSFDLSWDEGTGLINFKVELGNGTVLTITPEQIGASILSYLRSTAQFHLGRDVTRAVMSVPAEFDLDQRNQTKMAGALAGLDVWRVISEPTAAAMAYGLHELSGIQMVLVVDLGGGTLDVSLLNRQDGMFLTVAIAGNSFLGGQDFSLRLMEWIMQQSDLTKEKLSQTELQSLRKLAEEAKINLTNSESVTISTVSPAIHLELSRTMFEDINSDLFNKVLDPIKVVLEEAEITREYVDEIVLVGGSTRIPKVRKIIADYFQKEINVEVEPDLAVVTGVSIQAGVLGGSWPLQVSAIEIPMSARKIHVL